MRVAVPPLPQMRFHGVVLIKQYGIRLQDVVFSEVQKQLYLLHTRRIEVHKTARSTLSYGNEAWTKRKRDESGIVAAEMKFLWRTAGSTRLNYKNNSGIKYTPNHGIHRISHI